MLSDHKSPYVGRFACDWPRLSTTDPHAARTNGRPLLARGRPAGPPDHGRGPDRRSEMTRGYWPGTLEPAEPDAVPVLPGVAPSSTVTLEIFQTEPTLVRFTTSRTTSACGVVILLLT
jgi:hypothetical protein